MAMQPSPTLSTLQHVHVEKGTSATKAFLAVRKRRLTFIFN